MRRSHSASAEWRAHWPMVIGSMAGFSFYSIATYSMGLFMEPLQQAFGWSRAEISAGLILPAIASVLLSPVVGAMIDRWGARRVAIPGLALNLLAFGAFGLASGSVGQWMALWAFYALVAVGAKSTIWTAAVSSVFSTSRGMAIAVALCGAAVAQTLAPPITQSLIAAFGWRQAYFWLALGWGGPALLLVIFFLFDARDHDRRRAKKKPGLPTALALPGLTIAEAARSLVLWRIGLSTFLAMLFGIAVTVHEVPILTEAGYSREQAAYLAAIGGGSGLVGKLISGWMMDRMDAGLISGVTLIVSAIAYLLLLEPLRTPFTVLLAMAIIGYASGAKAQACAYLASRHGGMRNFGKIFGVIASLMALGSGIGPIMAGAIYDHSHSYAWLLGTGAVGVICAGLLVLGLGTYPDWEDVKARDIPGVRPQGSVARSNLTNTMPQ